MSPIFTIYGFNIYGLCHSFPGSTSIQNPRWRLVSGMFEFQQNNSAFQRSLHNVHTCQRLESIPKSFAEVHRYPNLFYYYRASKHLPFYEKDEVNAVAPDEDPKHCGSQLYIHIAGIYCGLKKSPQPSLHAISRFWMFISSAKIDR